MKLIYAGVDTDLSLSKQPQLPKKLSAHFDAETKANQNKISTLGLTSSWMLEDLYKTTIYICSNSCRLWRRDWGVKSQPQSAFHPPTPVRGRVCSGAQEFLLGYASQPFFALVSFPSRQSLSLPTSVYSILTTSSPSAHAHPL